MRAERVCPVCGGSKNEDEDMCNICVETEATDEIENDVDDLD